VAALGSAAALAKLVAANAADAISDPAKTCFFITPTLFRRTKLELENAQLRPVIKTLMDARWPRK
jgi:hypothetical protein